MVSATDLLKEGNTCVITGASSGIGRSAAIEFAQKGMNVWMVDVDAEELTLAKELVVSKKVSENQSIESRVVDVSDLTSMIALADEVFQNGGQCHFLMNNAGIGMGGGPLSADMDVVHRVMGVNTYGPIHGCLAFVPRMQQSDQPGIIVNTGSKQGITMPPGNLTYNMSKAALKCYTEGLEHELMKSQLEGERKLRAALLVPGWVNTSIHLKSVRAKAESKGETFNPDSVFFHEEKPASGAWMPKQVIDFMVAELDKGRFYVICPDNDVDRETDNLRMTWTMQDITKDRPPLSRWHPDFGEEFKKFLESEKKN